MNSSDPNNLHNFSIWYSKWHGYISLFICSIGIPLNIINIIVLSRQKMQTPINFILTCIAISDITTMLFYVPFAVHFYCQYSANVISSEKNSLAWMRFLLVHLNVTAIAHTISIWLAVALAKIRYHQIHSPSHGSLARTRRNVRARIIVGIIVLFSIVVLIPNYLCHKLEPYQERDNSTFYVFEEWRLGSEEFDTVRVTALALYSSLAKLVPCVLIIVYGGLLLRTLHKTIQHQRQLSATLCLNSKRRNNPSRTTTMLLIVFVLFLLTELPQGILIMCCIFFENFFERIYIPLGDVTDIIALINNGVNFILYCTMSQEFRRTFVEVFCPSYRKNHRNSYHASTMACHNNIKTSYI